MSKFASICQACVSKDRKLYPLEGLRTILREINMTEVTSVDGGMCWECATTIVKFYKFKKILQNTQSLLLNCVKLENLKCISTLGLKMNCDYNYILEYNADPLIAKTNIKIEDGWLDDNLRRVEDLNKEYVNINDETLKEEHNDPQQCDFNLNIEAVNINDEKCSGNIELRQHEFDDDTFNSSDEISLAEAAKELSENNIINSKNTTLKLRTNNKNQPKRFKKNTDTRSNEVNLNNKYVKIMYTEKEMEEKRDKKRNGPNFQVLAYKCDTCVLGFKKKEYYDDHVEKKHNGKLGDYPCPVCSIRFISETAMERHKKKHYVCYSCRFCKYETTAMMAILTHCKAKHIDDELNSIHCPLCDVVVKTPEEMCEHRLTEHPLYCGECRERFVSAASLRSHKRRIHNNKRQFPCTLCNRPFKTKQKLESHAARHHASLAQTLSYCQLCKVQYKNIYVYRSHLRNSALHAEEAHQCTECDGKFASKNYLKKHYNFYHLQKSQHKCDQCCKLFISDFRLRNHRRTQHGVSATRNYHCDVCEKQFFTQQTLKGHQQIHSEHRTYMCEDCGDTFKQRPALYNHHRLVHRGAYRNKNQTTVEPN